MKSSTLTLWRWVLAILFVVAGVFHFVNPRPYLSMMPQYLPWPLVLIWLSGVAEVIGGLGILINSTRRLAAWGLIALLIAVFPANLNIAFNGWPGVDIAKWVIWLRLPFQILFIWCVYRICLAGESCREV